MPRQPGRRGISFVGAHASGAPVGATAEWRAAVKPGKDGVMLDVEVVPGARESRFPAGFNAWRARLEAKVRAPPEEGQANAELCGLVAEALGVPAASVHVAGGHTSRRKSIAVRGVTPAQACDRLARTLR